MRNALIAILVTITFLLPATSAFAQSNAADQPQVPRLIRFASSASPHESGAVGMIFSLYKDQSGGAPLWQEVQNVTVDATGHYSVLLGSNSRNGLPAELFASNEARWLGVQVEQESEQPRVLLVSVPYALKAADAETVAGHRACFETRIIEILSSTRDHWS